MSDDAPKCIDQAFISQFCHSSSICIECSRCKRVHFGSQADGDFEEGEVERLLRNAETEPDKYVDHGTDWVRVGWFTTSFVFGCPCGFDKKVARLIWDSRHDILNFITQVSGEVMEDASRNMEAVKPARAALGIAPGALETDRFDDI
jgi:hypothetical protein